MNSDMNSSNTDEYYVTALQIFEYCGAESSGKLRVDALMDKFAPFIKTNKAEYSYLKSLLDPNQENPEISVTKLASALHKYSESQKCKVDLDESFNLRCGQVPQDSDSGISTDGFQLLEELQCELREKARLAHQLRSQLDFTDRQHEEVLATLTAERDSLRSHLNMLREENMTLSHVRRDYEEACDRLLGSERALAEARAELEGYRKRGKVLQEQVATLENEKLCLQDLLTKSKDECHRINEMYASRQSALLEQNETLKTDHADLAARLQDQDEFMQQLIKEKVLLEMELKDMLNKSNQTQLRMDRSIDISYTEDQMLTALDSLNADSRFSQDNCLLDEESFVNALKEDQGRATNLSLFDEIRLSFSHNMSRQQFENPTFELDASTVTVETQTVENPYAVNENASENVPSCDNSKDLNISMVSIEIQTDLEIPSDVDFNVPPCSNCKDLKTLMVTIATQTEVSEEASPCNKCKLDTTTVAVETQTDVEPCEVNDMGMQTEEIGRDCECLQPINVQTQTDDLFNNNNNTEACVDCAKCIECEVYKRNIEKLENDQKHSQRIVEDTREELLKYEDNFNILQKLVRDGKGKNALLQAAVDSLQSKIMSLEDACANQRDVIDGFSCEMCCVQSQTDCAVNSVGTQVETPCGACETRSVAPQRSIRRYFWEAVKCMFQVFAVVCFGAAVAALYGLSRPRPACRAPRDPTPWRWLHAQDLMDLFLRIEYVADVPM